MKSLNHSPIWLSETAIDSCGCAVNLSNTFVAGFLWLDKLGLSALNGVQVVLRQALHGTFLGLLYNAKDKSVKTNPDYWLSFLYKKLVGNQVFGVTVQPNDDNLRLYAGSSKSNSDFVVYGLSLANYSISLALPQLTNKQVVVYIVKESEPGNLQSKTTKLNGEVMDWTSHEPIFNIKGNVTTLPIEIPPYSQFFISAAPTAQKQCPQGWYTESTLANKCIKLVNHYTPPWFAANFDCTTFGINSTILSIENAFENSEITRLTAKTDCTQYYMGLYRNGSNWLWSNGDLSTYKNWKIGFPTNDLTKNCATFDAKTGDWSNMDCDRSQCYACQQYV